MRVFGSPSCWMTEMSVTLPSAGRDDRALDGRNPPLRIAKEPQEERSQQQRNSGEHRHRQPANERRNQNKCQSVIDAVANHGRLLIIEPWGKKEFV